MPKYKTQCCGEIIESKYRHDFVECKCGKSFVDGGSDYSRRGAIDGNFPVLIDKDNSEAI